MAQTCEHGRAFTLDCRECGRNKVVYTAPQQVAVAETPATDLSSAATVVEDFDLTQIPFTALVRIGAIFRQGEGKYGRDNWKGGATDRLFQLERTNHAIKHLLIYTHWLATGEYLGETRPDGSREDDLAKATWGCVVLMELERLAQQRTAS